MSTFTTSKPSNDVVVVNFPAEVLGGTDATELSDLLRGEGSAGAKKVVFNLESVTVMNSSGLGMLVSSLTTLRSLQAKLILTHVPGNVASLLSMTHLDTVFTIEPTVAQALIL